MLEIVLPEPVCVTKTVPASAPQEGQYAAASMGPSIKLIEQPTASVMTRSTIPPFGMPERTTVAPLAGAVVLKDPSALFVIVKLVPSTKALPPEKVKVTCVVGIELLSHSIILLYEISGLK